MNRSIHRILPAALLALMGCSPGDTLRSDETPPSDDTRTPSGWHAAYDDTLGTPTFLTPPDNQAPVLVDGVGADEAGMDFFRQNPAVCGLQNPDQELVLEEVVTLESMQTSHAVYRQMLGNIPVWGARIGVHFDRDGRISSVSGKCVAGVSLVDSTPSMSAAQARDAAIALLQVESDAGTQLTEPSVELVIYGLDGAPRPAWHVGLVYSSAVWDYVIDAADGSKLAGDSGIKFETGSGGGVLYHGQNVSSDIKSFEVEKASDGDAVYRMRLPGTGSQTELEVRDGRNCKLEVVGGHAVYVCGLVESSELTSGWDDVPPQAGQAVDVFYYLHEVDQYYRTVHGWASVDGAGIPLVAEVHAKGAADNANFSLDSLSGGRAVLAFGDIATLEPRLSLAGSPDVVAHEFQHGVTESLLDLEYNTWSESASLAEHLSDAFGAFFEHRVHPELQAFEFADASRNSARRERRMDDPLSLGAPDCMDKKSVGANLVYANSNILSHALYLMIMGGKCSTTQEKVLRPIGWDQAETLYFAVLRSKRVSSTASFEDFARATVAAALDLPNGDDKEAGPAVGVACAWDAVNVLKPEEILDTWKIECAERPSCFGGPACEEGRICSWNGKEDLYCCKAPPKGEHTCFHDDECKQYGENLICSWSGEKWYCVEPDPDCVPPPIVDCVPGAENCE